MNVAVAAAITACVQKHRVPVSVAVRAFLWLHQDSERRDDIGPQLDSRSNKRQAQSRLLLCLRAQLLDLRDA